MAKGKKITADCDQFKYDFDLFDGSDPGKLSVDDTDVVGYEFINQGNTIVRINDGLLLYPRFAGIEPSRWSSEIHEKENDTTIYRFKFEPLDNIVISATIPEGFANVPIAFPGLPAIPGFDPEFNQLLVITKIKVKI